MVKKLSFFPTLSKKKSKDLFTVMNPLFSYTKDGKSFPLVLSDPDASISAISDDNGLWNPNEYDLHLLWKISYQNGSWLYDSNNWEYACACHDAIIGVALSWFSSDSKRRDTIPIGYIYSDECSHELEIKHRFEPAELRGDIGFTIVLYIKKSGGPNSNEEHFANVPGVIISELDTFSIRLDGNGSFFTIYEVNRPGEPLWDVEYNIDDPSVDQFAECVFLCLNKAHKRFPLIKKDSGQFCQQLLVEIIANAMATVVEIVRAYEKDDTFDCLSNFEEGSVAQTLLYFRDKLLWNFATPATVSHSARMFIEKNIKNYENH